MRAAVFVLLFSQCADAVNPTLAAGDVCYRDPGQVDSWTGLARCAGSEPFVDRRQDCPPRYSCKRSPGCSETARSCGNCAMTCQEGDLSAWQMCASQGGGNAVTCASGCSCSCVSCAGGNWAGQWSTWGTWGTWQCSPDNIAQPACGTPSWFNGGNYWYNDQWYQWRNQADWYSANEWNTQGGYPTWYNPNWVDAWTSWTAYPWWTRQTGATYRWWTVPVYTHPLASVTYRIEWSLANVENILGTVNGNIENAVQLVYADDHARLWQDSWAQWVGGDRCASENWESCGQFWWNQWGVEWYGWASANFDSWTDCGLAGGGCRWGAQSRKAAPLQTPSECGDEEDPADSAVCCLGVVGECAEGACFSSKVPWTPALGPWCHASRVGCLSTPFAVWVSRPDGWQRPSSCSGGSNPPPAPTDPPLDPPLGGRCSSDADDDLRDNCNCEIPAGESRVRDDDFAARRSVEFCTQHSKVCQWSAGKCRTRDDLDECDNDDWEEKGACYCERYPVGQQEHFLKRSLTQTACDLEPEGDCYWQLGRIKNGVDESSCVSIPDCTTLSEKDRTADRETGNCLCNGDAKRTESECRASPSGQCVWFGGQYGCMPSEGTEFECAIDNQFASIQWRSADANGFWGSREVEDQSECAGSKLHFCETYAICAHSDERLFSADYDRQSQCASNNCMVDLYNAKKRTCVTCAFSFLEDVKFAKRRTRYFALAAARGDGAGKAGVPIVVLIVGAVFGAAAATIAACLIARRSSRAAAEDDSELATYSKQVEV